MNENELNIDEIRQICNEAIDYLQAEGKKVHKFFVDLVADLEKKKPGIMAGRNTTT